MEVDVCPDALEIYGVSFAKVSKRLRRRTTQGINRGSSAPGI